MNERIKQLESQCWEARQYGPPWFNSKKFAELIVRECIECADIVGKANLSSGYPNSTSHHIKQKIKEHFGVEE